VIFTKIAFQVPCTACFTDQTIVVKVAVRHVGISVARIWNLLNSFSSWWYCVQVCGKCFESPHFLVSKMHKSLCLELAFHLFFGSTYGNFMLLVRKWSDMNKLLPSPPPSTPSKKMENDSWWEAFNGYVVLLAFWWRNLLRNPVCFWWNEIISTLFLHNIQVSGR
jgi:hypothetical protein